MISTLDVHVDFFWHEYMLFFLRACAGIPFSVRQIHVRCTCHFVLHEKNIKKRRKKKVCDVQPLVLSDNKKDDELGEISQRMDGEPIKDGRR